jgi:hypothetical protein
MEELLVEEREAIVRLDGARVGQLAQAKLALAKELEASTLEERRPVSGRLQRMVRNLRTNGVLLSHARGILHELLAGPPALTHPRQLSRPTGRLSIQG